MSTLNTSRFYALRLREFLLSKTGTTEKELSLAYKAFGKEADIDRFLTISERVAAHGRMAYARFWVMLRRVLNQYYREVKKREDMKEDSASGS